MAIFLPPRSRTEWTGESAGTATTQRTGLRLALEYIRSATTVTWESFSMVQSLPVMPQSKVPFST